jgi:hypothetical protein
MTVSKFPSPNACPIRERTGDGRPVGRCWYHCPGDVCPRHGDVSGPLTEYRATGRLTDENDLPQRMKGETMTMTPRKLEPADPHTKRNVLRWFKTIPDLERVEILRTLTKELGGRLLEPDVLEELGHLGDDVADTIERRQT